jgi:hypothetical protein
MDNRQIQRDSESFSVIDKDWREFCVYGRCLGAFCPSGSRVGLEFGRKVKFSRIFFDRVRPSPRQTHNTTNTDPIKPKRCSESVVGM